MAALVAMAVAAAGCGSHASRPSPAEQHYTKQLAAADAPNTVPADVPIPTSFFRASIAEYRRYAERVAIELGPQVQAIRAALADDNRTAAQSAWSVAFSHYLSLGAVYGEFGQLDDSIDGLPGGLPGGVADPHFTGPHRLEYGLWTG